MPRIRTIKPEYAFDVELSQLPHIARLFFILLWTHCDKEGRAEDNPVKLRALIFPYEPKVEVEDILTKLIPKFVIRYAVDGKSYLQVRQWGKHQRPHHTEPDSTIPACPETIRQRLDNGECPLSHGEEPAYKGREGKGNEIGKERKGNEKVESALCPHDEIVALYHKTLPELPMVAEWGKARREFLAKRWFEKPERQSLDWWQTFFSQVAASDFLCGRRGDFKANLEWLVRPTNFIKVIEGNYKNGGNNGINKSKPGFLANPKPGEYAGLEHRDSCD